MRAGQAGRFLAFVSLVPPENASSWIQGRNVELAARDPEHIRSMLPLMWLTSTLYFRAEVLRMQEALTALAGERLFPPLM
jgi:hypothetical protein